MQARTVIAAATLSALAIPALAVTQASLALSDFSYTLKDLNAADAVTPALTWTGNASLTSYSLDLAQTGWTQSDSWLQASWRWSDGFNATGSSVLDKSTALGHVEMTTGSDGLTSLSVSSTSPTGFDSSVNASYTQSFTLSAGSQVTFRYVLNGGLSGAAGTGMWSPPEGTFQDLHSLAGYSTSLYVGQLSSAWSATGSNDWRGSSAAYDGVVDGQTVQLTLRNAEDTARTYVLTVGVYASSRELAAPVPEPASYALIALGLAVVGTAARRRRT